jgi:uncharacterized protein YggE
MKQLNLFCLFILCALAGQSQKNFIDQPFIEVTGSADTLVTPDEIYIRIFLSEKDSRDRLSIEDEERKMVEALKALGLDTEKDLKTAGMASNFRYYLLKGKGILKSKRYLLKVRDAVMASRVFMRLEELGISNASIDRVDHSNLEGIRNAMRAGAIANARARAVVLTRPLSQQPGRAIHIADSEHFDRRLQGRAMGVVVTGYASRVKAEDEESLPLIEFEKIRVAVEINAKFILN